MRGAVRRRRAACALARSACRRCRWARRWRSTRSWRWRGDPVISVRPARTESGQMSAITARLADGVASIPAEEWDACAGSGNPFVSHAFLSALEESRERRRANGLAAAADRGRWRRTARPRRSPRPMPRATARANMCSITAGPTPGSARAGAIIPSCRSPRRSRRCRGRGCCCASAALAPALIAAIEAVTDQNDLSSAHVTFVVAGAGAAVRGRGLADPRRARSSTGPTDGYASFDDFLGALASRKRKAIRRGARCRGARG